VTRRAAEECGFNFRYRSGLHGRPIPIFLSSHTRSKANSMTFALGT
jgi:hypothetical protein